MDHPTKKIFFMGILMAALVSLFLIGCNNESNTEPPKPVTETQQMGEPVPPAPEVKPPKPPEQNQPPPPAGNPKSEKPSISPDRFRIAYEAEMAPNDG